MAEDHFQTHRWTTGETRWAFHLLFDSQPQVHALVDQFQPILNHSTLYPRIPRQWLHATILTVKNNSEITRATIDRVCELLQPKLNEIVVPELTVGSPWVWDGSVVLRITPGEELEKIYAAVLESVNEYVDTAVPATNRFIPHMTLAYARSSDDETGLEAKVGEMSIEPVSFVARSLSLVRQCQMESDYRWELVQKLPLAYWA